MKTSERNKNDTKYSKFRGRHSDLSLQINFLFFYDGKP